MLQVNYHKSNNMNNDEHLHHDRVLKAYEEIISSKDKKDKISTHKDIVKNISKKISLSENAVMSALEYWGITVSDMSSIMKYEISPQYNTRGLDSNYDPIRYRIKVYLENLIHLRISDIAQIDKYNYVYEIKINVGDEVVDVKSGKKGVVERIDEGPIYKILLHDDTIVKRLGSNISKINNNKLKPNDISDVYMLIKSKCDEKMFDEVEYFSVFCDYFRINPKQVYDCLNIQMKAVLVSKLKDSTKLSFSDDGGLF